MMTKRAAPLVSVGMPVRNCEDTLPLAIRSLLGQTYENWELLLIDDSSTDETGRVARQFSDPRIRFFASATWLGLPAQLNRAIGWSRGVYFARMDGDDVAYPERLQKQVVFLEANLHIDLVGAAALVFGAAGQALGKRAGPSDHATICAHPWAGFPLVHPTYMGRRSWFQRHGYREIGRGQDQDLLLRSYRSSCFANLPQILLGYREERVDLGKILTTRRSFARAAFRHFRQEGQTVLALRSVLEQVLKGFTDVVAVASGSEQRLLPHRAMPASPVEKDDWLRVWRPLQEEMR